jgi:hypothetical protein
METAELDSHKDLGINAVPSDRLQFQKVVTCSPIAFQGHTGVTYGPLCGTSPENCTVYQAYDFGPVSSGTNYTYLYDPGTIGQRVGYAIK